MSKRLLRLFSLLLFLALAVLICGSAMSVEFAFDVSRLTRTPLFCRLLLMPQIDHDYLAPASQVRPYCIAMVVARFGTIDDCLAIQDRDGEAAHTMRHACIDALASRLHEPRLCEAIEYPKTNDLSDFNEEYRDRCRSRSITTLEECTTGFHTAGWAEGVAQRCHQYLALNLHDPSLCSALDSQDSRAWCLEAVELLDDDNFRTVR